ncbi:MAG TPA: alpha-N-arabinofuranosidase [Anaerolineales bacterium]|nr:alpha-N-arabinofuranosidase [Anaerolineales bacterium]
MDKITIRADQGETRIDRHIYGHFAEHLGRCVYDGFWVGEESSIPNTRGIRRDIVEALRKLRIPNLRWPGGCFADEYHWMDGIGPRAERPTMVNTHWGGVTENNHFGTHEFMDLCAQLECEPYICGNVGSGTVREMQQWVEYLTCAEKSPISDLRAANGRSEPWRLSFWGVGNESWGCGGNMRPEYYADEYRRYATYCRNFGDNRLFKIACGPNSRDYRWTETLMERIPASQMHGLSLHHYSLAGSWAAKGSATEFTEGEWFRLLQQAWFMDELVQKHSEIMDRHDPEKKVALVVDEWGAWHDVEPGTNPGFLYQQNTLRDALVAGITLNIFNNHCDRVRMACIAQTVNVLQAMILTQGERMILTPSYHVFEMYQVHQDALMLPVEVACENYGHQAESIPSLSVSASRSDDGTVHLSICNAHPKDDMTVAVDLSGMSPQVMRGRILTASQINAHNTFDNMKQVKPVELAATKFAEGVAHLELPGKSVAVFEIS